MAERPQSDKRNSPARAGYGRRRQRSAANGASEPAEATGAAQDSESGAASGELTLEQAMERIADLEADLAAAKTTIRALLDKAERRATNPAAPAALAAPSASAIADAAIPPASMPPAAASEAELRGPRGNLDQVVRQRTRALAESEAQLRKKNAELERLNEMKAEFISIATHELRTPLTSIVGYLDLVAEGRFGQLPRPMERPVSSLRRNAQRLMHLVDEMLDVSRIDSGRIALYRQPCDLGAIAASAVAELEPLASPKQLQLSTTVESPPPIDADAEKIHQAISKLVANALRHTPEGGAISVVVDVAPEFPEHPETAWARLRVKGTGVGIPNHLRNRIFEPFTDVNTAKHHTSTGPDSAGLGLYIARGLIDMHGGLISVSLEEGAYIEFTVLLPRATK